MPSVSLARHGDGWRVVWREGGAGSKRHFSEVREDKNDARSDADLIRARLVAAKELTAGRVRLPWAEVVDRWAATRAPGRYRLEAVKYFKAKPWVDTMAVTVAHAAGLPANWQRGLKSILRWAKRLLNQPVDPQVLDLPVTKPRRRPETPLLEDGVVAQVQIDADGWSPGTGALVHLLITYGHRAESLVRLTIDAVDMKKGTLTIPVKSGDVIRHPLLPETVARIRALAKRKGPLFRNHLGVGWVDGAHFATWFNHTMGFGYYDLKRWAISRMLAAGLDAKTVASITGHRTVNLLLNTYMRTNHTRQLAALEVIQTLNMSAGCQPKKS